MFQKRFSMLLMVFLILFITPCAFSADYENYTHKLSQSNATYEIWTTNPGERVFKNSEVPSTTESQVKLYAAKNETEPFLIVIKPTSSGTITVSAPDFGSGITTELYQVKHVNITTVSDNLGKTGDYPDPLWPVEFNSSINITSMENTAFWFSVKVPAGTIEGDYNVTVTIAGVSIPVSLHVFNFSIPEEVHVKSQMNFSHSAVLSKYSVTGTGADHWMYVDKMKQFFIDHRLTPKSALWSGGLTTNGCSPYIDYDDTTGTLSDPHGIWGFENPADKYLNGNGFNNGTGFPSFMAATFLNNDSSVDQRPSTFAGETRTSSDWGSNPSSSYNLKWFSYITDLRDYLSTTGFLDKAYYYFANEPQDQADYDAVAWYSQELKKAAPDLKLMISEEPKSEIYNHSTHTGSKIDIWLPVLNEYNPEISHERESNYDEETWIYFLHGTRPPYFNPITLDHPGIESKFTGWFLWKYRIKGIAYYSMNDWDENPWTNPATDNHNGDKFMFYPPSVDNTDIAFGSNNHRLVPSIRVELMRDGLEDFEYLYVLNGSSMPLVNSVNTSDTQADKIISDLTSYTRDSEFLYNIRRLIGLKNGNEIATIPDISPQNLHERSLGQPGSYYINFQDPAAQPVSNPLIFDGKEYEKIGWNEYDDVLGYGWYGDMAHAEYRYLSSGPNELQKSVIYDDWGREKTFEYDIPNGVYNVTVSAGWQGKTYSHNKITIEGIDFINDEATSPYIVRSYSVTVNDNKLTMNMGIFDEYTMLNYLKIESAGTFHKVTVSSGANGIISPSATQYIAENGSFTFKIIPDSGYEIDFLKIDGSTVSVTNNSYTISNVTKEYSVEVEFKEISGAEEPEDEEDDDDDDEKVQIECFISTINNTSGF